MELRRRTETRLRARFVAAGGTPQRVSPHYFVLGSSSWYRGLAADMAEVVLPLAMLPSDVTSVTYPDSFTAMGLGPDYGLPHDHRPYHGRVYRLEELPDLVATYGLPPDEADPPGGSEGVAVDGYDGYERRPFEKYIEVQLWADGPLGAPGMADLRL